MCSCVCVYVCVYIHTHTCTHIHAHNACLHTTGIYRHTYTYINTHAHANEVDDDPPAYAIGRRSRLERLLARNLAETQRRQSWSSEEEVGEGVGPLSVRSQNVISLRQLRELLEQRQEEGEEAGVARPGQTAVACRQQ